MSTYDRIYEIVLQIPVSKVATYGQIADLAGLHGKARLVGYALFKVDTDSPDIPWHRVVNAKGEVSHSSLRKGSDYLQKHLLEEEGIEFDPKGRVNLDRYQWQSLVVDY